MVDQAAFEEALRAIDPAGGRLAQSLRRAIEAAGSVPGADHVGLRLRDPYGELRTVAWSGPPTHVLGQLEDELGEGPSVLAVATDDIVMAGNAATEPRWPRLAGLLDQQRVRSVLAVPVRVRGRTVGALTLVGEESDQVGPRTVDTACALADVLAEFLDAAATVRDLAGRVHELERALTRRVLVEQAKGVLMERDGLGADAAMAELRGRARAARRSLLEQARVVLDGRRTRHESAPERALERLTGIALSRPSLDRLPAELPEPLAALADADAVAVLLVSGEPATLVATAASGLASAAEGAVAPLDAGLSGQAVATRRAVYADDLPERLREPVLAGSAVRAVGAVPVMVDEHPAAVLLVARQAPRPFTSTDRDRLARAADLVAVALGGARRDELAAIAQAATRLANKRLRRLRAVSAALTGALTPAAVVRAVVQEGVAAFDGSGGVVVVPTGDDKLEVIGAHGLSGVSEWARFPLSADIPLAEAARTGSPVWVHDPAEWDRRYPASAGMLGGEHQASASLPLRGHDDKLLGIFGLSFAQPQRFAENDRLYLLALADELSQALERAQLFEAAERERVAAVAAEKRAAYLAEASALLATSLDPEETLHQIAWLAVPTLADICVVHLVEGDFLKAAAVAGADTATLERVTVLSTRYPWPVDAKGVWGEALRTRRAILLAEVADPVLTHIATDATQLAMLRELEVTSYIVAPLVGRPELLGSISFVRQRGGATYTQADVALAEALAVRAGTALDNARRFHALGGGVGPVE